MINELRHWLTRMQYENGGPPSTIPVTRSEVMEIQQDAGQFIQEVAAPHLFNIPLEETVFAPSIRERRLQVSTSQYLIEFPLHEVVRHNSEFLMREGCRILKHWCLTDKTRIKVEFEWDIWAPVKRLFRLPVRHRTAEIDCSVLYPLAKVQFPHNKHTVHLDWLENR